MPLDEISRANTAAAVAHQILVVDDDAATAAALKAVLERRQYSVTVAKDGGQAQSSFVMHKPDLVLLDLILPGESGFEVCERMKRNDESVPVVILSAIDMPDSRALADRVGADAYLTKPVSADVLFSTIDATAQRVWEKWHTSKSTESKRIRFSCRCGKRFKVSPAHRGKTLTCPACGESLTVPRFD